MEARTARFGQITPQSKSYAEDTGIPKRAYEMMTAQTLYLLMSPESQGGPMAQSPAVTTTDKMSVIIAECPPGDRPLLHAHHKTNETFFASMDASASGGVTKGKTRLTLNRWT